MNTKSINLNNLSQFTDAEIQEMVKTLAAEVARRENEKRDIAILAFKKAFHDLKALGISPYYNDSEWDEGVSLTDWNCFNF